MAMRTSFTCSLPSSLETRDLIRYVLFSLTSVFIGDIIYYRYFHPLRHFPGLWLASITRLWLAWHHLWGTELHTQWMLIKKHVIRVTPTMLLIADSNAMPVIFHRQDTKSRFYLQGYVGKSNSVLLRVPDAHVVRRRLIGASYALKMEPLLHKHILHWSHYLAYDTIIDLGFRNPFGFKESGSDVGGLIEGFLVSMVISGVAGRIYLFTEILLNTWLKEWLVVHTE